MKLPYEIHIFYSEEDEGYIATVHELSGCSAFGETQEEALNEVVIAARLWLQAAKKERRPVPEPIMTRRFSGRFALRIPKELHRELEREATEQGISLNQWLLYKLAHEKPILIPKRRRAA
ncbi:MAG: type II toxin-antitoxin system HicB family antitoxin [Deltaproteobacteria bacterium]|nr:type II toxin-antitoxin system HicB family antitoxin [Deltaproteobacteria bacterium]